ncbi:MAG: HlyD family type I secretion periplasmic adaptor subunit [Burkholderiaceae bacterium]|nr:HlyD family type I secretion periplasmic adaptor subunit [Burkholderiaceae bacterium]
MKKVFDKKADAADVVVHDVSGQPINTDATVHTRLGWLVVLAGIGGFLLWATFAPLDKGVPVSGTVSSATNRKAIQHLTGGTVEDILVKEGDTVKAGQVLVKMNDVQAKSQEEMTRVQYYSALAAEARLLAERDGKREVAFSQELMVAKADPHVAAIIATQNELFTSRRSAVESESAANDESISGYRAQAKGLEEARDNMKTQAQLIKEQLDGLRDLAKDGYIARNRLLDQERMYAQVNGQIAEAIGNIGHVRKQISEMELRKIERQQDYQKEVRGQLAEAEKETDALASRLKEQDFVLANVLVRAPVDGTVVGMNIFTRGGVIGSGFRMMDIVPSDDPLVVEGMVPVNLIDKVHVGLKADMIFTAFNQNKTPHIPGVVTQVSADRLVDEKSGQPYYKMRVEVAPEGKKLIANLPIRPGMPAEVFVRTGERTMMNYLFKPVFDRAKMAMTEE